MTEKEINRAISYLLFLKARNNTPSVDIKLSTAIEALEKQIPYTPKPYKQYAGTCKCGVIFMDRTTNYCGNCGQRLDWGD